MWFSDELKHKVGIAGFEALAPDHFDRLPLPTASGNFAAFSRKPNIGCPFVTGNWLNRQAKHLFENSRHPIGSVSWSYAAKLDGLFCHLPLLNAANAASLGQSTGTGILHRYSKP